MVQIEYQTVPGIQTDIYTRPAPQRLPRLARQDHAPHDTLQLSPEAREAAAQESALRERLIQRIRTEIGAGQYLTPEKLDVAAEALCKELRSSR